MYREYGMLTTKWQKVWGGTRKSNNHMWHIPLRTLLTLVALAIVTTSCQFTQSAFALQASNAGSTFAAAALTLRYEHGGIISTAYASSSFMNYQSQLQNVGQQLPAQSGAPDIKTIQELLKLYQPAMHAINAPCLHTSCDWHVQLAVLHQASQAFLKAGEQ